MSLSTVVIIIRQVSTVVFPSIVHRSLKLVIAPLPLQRGPLLKATLTLSTTAERR